MYISKLYIRQQDLLMVSMYSKQPDERQVGKSLQRGMHRVVSPACQNALP